MESRNERGYLSLLEQILFEGKERKDRTGVGTKSVFGPQLHFDLYGQFPLLTTKKLHWKSIVHELLWFLNGDTNIKYLNDNGVKIWDKWADKNGDLGPIYGKQWRAWRAADEEREITPSLLKSDQLLSTKTVGEVYIDQLEIAINQIINTPNSRRIVVSAWNVGDIPQMNLPPCHMMYQFYVDGDQLSCKMYQRSADMFLGVPFNIASYALLTYMIAHITGKVPGELIISFGDAHIYQNHVEQVKEQLSRAIKKPPHLMLPYSKKDSAIGDFEMNDFILEGYEAHPHISATIAV